METATIFVTGFYNEIPTGALMLLCDQLTLPEGVKTAPTDQNVTQTFLGKHVRIGIDSLKQLINRGLTVKHLRFWPPPLTVRIPKIPPSYFDKGSNECPSPNGSRMR
jgi:hypothetical protein